MNNINIGKPVFCPSTTEVRYGIELPIAGSRGPMPCPGPTPEPIPGPTGPQGPQGPQGLHGHLGPQGPQGAMGAGVAILGVYSDVTELPFEAKIGDSYIAGNSVYAYVGYKKGDKDTPNFAWKEYQHLVPVPGETGPQGPQGKDGKMGLIGPTGPQGPMGDRGRDGYVVLKFKEDAIHCTEVGDGFVAPDNGHLFILVKTGVEPKFVDAGQIQGPQGPVGPQGPKGEVRDTSDLVKLSLDEDIVVNNKIGCYDVGEVIKSTDSIFSILKKLFSGEEMETKMFYGAVAQDYYESEPTAEIIRSLIPTENYKSGSRFSVEIHPDTMGVLIALPKSSKLKPSDVKGSCDDIVKFSINRSVNIIYDGTPYIIYYGVSTDEWGIEEPGYFTIQDV